MENGWGLPAGFRETLHCCILIAVGIRFELGRHFWVDLIVAPVPFKTVNVIGLLCMYRGVMGQQKIFYDGIFCPHGHVEGQ